MKKYLVAIVVGLVLDFAINCLFALGVLIFNENFLVVYFNTPHIAYWLIVGVSYFINLILTTYRKVDSDGADISDVVASGIARLLVMGLFILIMVIIF
ncbi:MAG: hypothetical protein LIR50_11920 [Bacillota bacterium]|nr:hypothetical protein [Bacillota bacterium]